MSKGLSIEVIKALQGRTIIRVGDRGLHLDNGKAIYLEDDEIEALNSHYEPVPVKDEPKRYVIRFSEREAGANESAWQCIATEDYDERKDVVERFNKSVALCHNDINSVSIVVIDTKRLQYQMPDDEILCYTKIVD